MRLALAAGLALQVAGLASAQGTTPVVSAPSSSAAPGETSFLVQNLTRGELWRFFEPRPGGGVHPDYAFVGNRSTLGARYRGPRWGLQGAIQYVRLENLPNGAIGPGLLGTGAAYFFQSGTFSYQFYLRSLSATYTDQARGAWLEAGRFSRAAIEEPPSGDDAIDVITRAHLNGRLLGDMEWSMYQRAWDGVRGGVTRPGWRATLTAALPTQGTYEESANLTMDRLRVGAVEVSTRAGTLVPHTALGVFGYVYDDRRRVSSRPDNQPSLSSGGAALATADVTIATVGASAVAAFRHASGRWDALGWAAVQSGDWYGTPHRAWSATGQAGHQWTRAPWQPWLRGGIDYASGDGRASDAVHGTFFPMLPSGNHLARSNTYALMNVVDGWIDARLSPASTLDVVIAAHRVGLASASDRWYTGSGATARAGSYFGFQGRTSGGGRRLGTLIESEIAWRATTWWTLRGYAGRMTGGDVVRNLFADGRLVTAWVESRFSF